MKIDYAGADYTLPLQELNAKYAKEYINDQPGVRSYFEEQPPEQREFSVTTM